MNSDIWNCKWRLWLSFYKIVDQRIGTYILILSNFLNKKSNWLSGKHLAEPVVSLRKSLRFEFFQGFSESNLAWKNDKKQRVSMFLVLLKWTFFEFEPTPSAYYIANSIFILASRNPLCFKLHMQTDIKVHNFFPYNFLYLILQTIQVSHV